MKTKSDVYRKITRSTHFPTLPEILVKLLEACEDKERSLADIAEIISKDPVLSFKVLQLVNSAYYGIDRKFISIEQAVVYLGADSVKNVAVTTAIHQVFEYRRFRKVKRFCMREFWWHSLSCATLAKRIARKVGFSNFDEAYLSGLLHDVGRLVLLSIYPKEHELILTKTEEPENILWAETQLIGVTHCEVGAWLVRKWQLASIMADAVQYHHEPLDQVQESFILVKIIYFSNMLSDRYQKSERTIETGRVMFGFAENDIEEIVEGALEEVQDIAASLDISIKPPLENLFNGSGQAEEEEGGMAKDAKADAEETAGEDENDTESNSQAEMELRSRIKNVSLLTSFLENLVQAGDTEKIISAFELCANTLFDVDKVLFFLPDKQDVLLSCRTSATNPYKQMSGDMTLPLQRTSSKIVQAYHGLSVTHLAKTDDGLSIADNQVLSLLNCQTMLLVPVAVDEKPVGIILLGLPEKTAVLSKGDNRLLQVIVKQVGLCLYLEREKIRKAEEIETERMAAISMTAKKFAHEINNPLGIISNYITSAKLKLSEEKNVQEDLEIIGDEIKRISLMINQLDLIEPPAPGDLEKVELNGVIQDIVKIVKDSVFKNSGTVISFTPEASLPLVLTSRDAMKQIFINLVKNAAEAMEDGGNIEVTTRTVPETSEEHREAGVEIIISDDGPGLPQTVIDNLYKPFVTTKGVGHSGLGLAIVHKAIQDLGGSISCVSEAKLGTTFTLFIPLEKR